MTTPENFRVSYPNIPVRVAKLEQGLGHLNQFNKFLTEDSEEAPTFMDHKATPERLGHLREHRVAIQSRIESGIKALEQKQNLMRDLAKQSVVMGRVNLIYPGNGYHPVKDEAQRLYLSNLDTLLQKEGRTPKNAVNLPEVPPSPKTLRAQGQLGVLLVDKYLFPDGLVIGGLEARLLAHVLPLSKDHEISVRNLCICLFPDGYTPEHADWISETVAQFNRTILTSRGFMICRSLPPKKSINDRSSYFTEARAEAKS